MKKIQCLILWLLFVLGIFLPGCLAASIEYDARIPQLVFAAQEFKGALKEPVIGQGSAPLEDEMFRAAVFEQLGESRLEGALTTDICGKKESHAVRLDAEAVDTIKKSQLHKKVATVIFFESNGGQTKQVASIPDRKIIPRNLLLPILTLSFCACQIRPPAR